MRDNLRVSEVSAGPTPFLVPAHERCCRAALAAGAGSAPPPIPLLISKLQSAS